MIPAHWLTISIIGAAAYLVLVALCSLRMLKHTSWLSVTAFFTLKCLMALALVAFVYILIHGGQLIEKDNLINEDELKPKVAFVEDVSGSMGLLTADGQKRSQKAERVYQSLANLCEAQKELEPQLERLAFASHCDDHDKATEITDQHSRLSSALVHTIKRVRPRKLVLVSDGATDLRDFPTSWLEQMRRHRLDLYSILPGRSESVLANFKIDKLLYEREDPRSIEVSLSSTAKKETRLALNFFIDGKAHSLKRIDIQKKANLVFELPSDMKAGLHTFKFVISEPQRDIYPHDNLEYGHFLVSSKIDKILLLKSRKASLENRLLVTAMRNHWPELIEISGEDLKTSSKKIPWRELRLLIVLDIPFNALPRRFMKRMQDSKGNVLLIGEHTLNSLARSKTTLNPFAAPLSWIRSDTAKDKDGTWQAEGTSENPFSKLKHYPRIWAFAKSKLLLTAKSLASVHHGENHHPVLIETLQKESRWLVFTARETWKWAFHPDAEIRLAHAAFFDHLFDHAMKPLKEQLLVVTSERDPGVPNHYAITVKAQSPLAISDFSQIKLVQQRQERRTSLKLQQTEGALRHHLELGEESEMLVFRASGKIRGRDNQAEPHVLVHRPHVQKEIKEFQFRPQTLKNLVKLDADRYSDLNGHEEVLSKLFEDISPVTEKVTRYLRNHELEMMLALAAATLLALSWLLERMMRRQAREALS